MLASSPAPSPLERGKENNSYVVSWVSASEPISLSIGEGAAIAAGEA